MRRSARRRHDAELFLQARRRRGVLKPQPLARIDVVEGLLRHQRALVKSGQDQLKLAGIPVDVADGENARHAGFEAFGIDRDVFLVLQLESQSATVRQAGVAVPCRSPGLTKALLAFDKSTIGATQSFSRPLFDSSSADKQFGIRPDIILALAASSRNNSSSDSDKSRHQLAQNRPPFSEQSPFCKLPIIVHGAGPYTIDECLDRRAQYCKISSRRPHRRCAPPHQDHLESLPEQRWVLSRQ